MDQGHISHEAGAQAAERELALPCLRLAHPPESDTPGQYLIHRLHNPRPLAKPNTRSPAFWAGNIRFLRRAMVLHALILTVLQFGIYSGTMVA